MGRPGALSEASAAALNAEAITIPAEPKLFTANATVEKLTSLLAEQGGRFAVLAPEGKDFIHPRRRYIPAPPAQVAEWAGRSVAVLLRVYAKCIDGQDQIAKRRIEDALREPDDGTAHGDDAAD